MDRKKSNYESHDVQFSFCVLPSDLEVAHETSTALMLGFRTPNDVEQNAPGTLEAVSSGLFPLEEDINCRAMQAAVVLALAEVVLPTKLYQELARP